MPLVDNSLRGCWFAFLSWVAECCTLAAPPFCALRQECTPTSLEKIIRNCVAFADFVRLA